MKLVSCVAAAVCLAIVVPASATEATKIKDTVQSKRPPNGQKQRLGTLSCEVAGGIGMLIGSSRNVECRFARARGPSERYSGTIGKLGVDIGITGKSYIQWVVFNLEPSGTGEGALAGTYVGASASAALGVGLGANALIGGTARSFGLQPLSAEGMTGLNVAAGVTRLELRAAK
ncbi:DUF992 domain-containing protein [Rhizobium lusitanum]|uniref:DUF992 domain-containing protein n=1 Tax=Rhizobium lusitanum TaxID=293958 RepID=A0A6L9UJX3_9HYPH|nr:DUF992 domain-containing protein [Rhizobium lusitanum]NEI74868.1 DUF992 domain-containing protein [Rhizobium lusitanum]